MCCGKHRGHEYVKNTPLNGFMLQDSHTYSSMWAEASVNFIIDLVRGCFWLVASRKTRISLRASSHEQQMSQLLIICRQSNRSSQCLGGKGSWRKQNSINHDLKDQHCFFIWPCDLLAPEATLKHLPPINGSMFIVYLSTTVWDLHLKSRGTAALSFPPSSGKAGMFLNCVVVTIRRGYDNTIYLQTCHSTTIKPCVHI